MRSRITPADGRLSLLTRHDVVGGAEVVAAVVEHVGTDAVKDVSGGGAGVDQRAVGAT